MTPLLKRILAEKRSIVIPLAIALVANVLAYFIVVRPLAVKSSGAADRAAAAAAGLQAAERDMALARALVNGKSRADDELGSFYKKVLPADQTAARRMTYASLPALARRTSVRYEARTTAIEDPKGDTRLGRMNIRMILEGSYENVRQFIYELETAPEFVILDDLTLAETNDSGTLALTINLSTYFRVGTNGI